MKRATNHKSIKLSPDALNLLLKYVFGEVCQRAAQVYHSDDVQDDKSHSENEMNGIGRLRCNFCGSIVYPKKYDPVAHKKQEDCPVVYLNSTLAALFRQLENIRKKQTK